MNQLKAILLPDSVFPSVNEKHSSIAPWKNPDPALFPYIIFRTEDYIKIQAVIDKLGCRQEFRDAGAVVYTVPSEAVINTEGKLERSQCETNETKEWYKISGKLLVCQDCHTKQYDIGD